MSAADAPPVSTGSPAGAPTHAPARSTWSLRGALEALVIAGIALGAGGAMGYLVAHEPVPDDGAHRAPSPRPSAPAPDPARAAPVRELALLTPLHEGGEIAGFTIAEILGVDSSGMIRIVCRRGADVVKLDVALRAEGGPPAPAVSGRYAVFYSTTGASPADGDALARAVASALDANTKVPAPPGMRPFVAGKGPGGSD